MTTPQPPNQESKTPMTDAEIAKNEGKVMSVSSSFARTLELELAEATRLLKFANNDWADTDTKLRAIAKRHYPDKECEHDGYGVIPVEDIFDRMSNQLQTLQAERDDIHKCLLNREQSLKQSGEDWVKTKTELDTYKSIAADLAVNLQEVVTEIDNAVGGCRVTQIWPIDNCIEVMAKANKALTRYNNQLKQEEGK